MEQHNICPANSEDSGTAKEANYHFPEFSSSSEVLNEIYRYREYVYQKHIRDIPDGHVVTEFYPPVPWGGSWGGPYNTISCAASHHIRDGRWLTDPTPVCDYARFWLRPDAPTRVYSFPLADSVMALTEVTGDKAFADKMYSGMRENYEAWCKTHRRENRMFYQHDGYDGMEFSISGSGIRPTINSYQYADARALSGIAARTGQTKEALYYAAEASFLKQAINSVLWNENDGFYETVHEDGSCSNVRELIGFVPWIYGIPPKGENREKAFLQLWDKDGFYGEYGPTTAERRHPDFNKHFDHECLWNGPSWPYATTQTLSAMITLLQSYEQSTVSPEDFMRLLMIYAKSQHDGDTPYIDENLDADTGEWIARKILKETNHPTAGRGVDYNHSAFIDLVIRGVCGLIPSTDNVLAVAPLGTSLSEFSLRGVRFHGHTVDVLWRKTEGLCVFADGNLCASNADGSSVTVELI